MKIHKVTKIEQFVTKILPKQPQKNKSIVESILKKNSTHEKALEFKLGARGLRSICEAILNEAMYDLPSKNETSFRVTLNYAQAQFSGSKMAKLRVA